VASPAYLAKHRALRNPSDLSRHRVIQFTGLEPSRDWTFVRDSRVTRITVPIDFVTNSADAAIVHAEHGGGVAMLLSYQVRDAVRAKRLKVVLHAYEPPPRPVNIVFPTARLLSAKVRAFVDFVASTQHWRFVDL
jgi:DNA-binding transcriptional LysR family regulator